MSDWTDWRRLPDGSYTNMPPGMHEAFERAIEAWRYEPWIAPPVVWYAPEPMRTAIVHTHPDTALHLSALVDQYGAPLTGIEFGWHDPYHGLRYDKHMGWTS